jgi:pimeloyl-ACP methyl ester carboxylesterase
LWVKFSYIPKGFKPENAANYRIASVIHGTLRAAEKLRDAFVDFADETNTLILAPLFPCGIIDHEDIHNFKFIKFHDIRFDQVLLDMIDDVREAFGIVDGKILLHGFSGGGQFVHRMFYLHPDRLAAVSVGDPGRATYLDESEDWYAGIRDFETQFGKPIDMAVLKKVPVLLLVGLEDTESVDYTEDASFTGALKKYGDTRLERIRALLQNYVDHGLNARLEEVPGLGHEGLKMVAQVIRFFKQVLGPVHTM